MVGVDRVELPPRVPRTRMLALHHTPDAVESLKSNVQSLRVKIDFGPWTFDIGYLLSMFRRTGAPGETRTHDTGFAIRRLSRLATRARLSGTDLSL